MSTSGSLPGHKKLGALTLSEFRERARASRPVAFMEIPLDPLDENEARIYDGICCPILWKDDRPGLMGYGPLPRYIKDSDPLVSIRYRKSIVTFFGVAETPAISSIFKLSSRTLVVADSPIKEEEAVLTILPEIPCEVDPKGVCCGILTRSSKHVLVRVVRGWLEDTKPQLIGGDVEFPSFAKAGELMSLIVKVTGLLPAWTDKWTIAHDRIRRKKATQLLNIELPIEYDNENDIPY